MLGLPAEAKVPRTSFTVRSFSFLCPNPEDSRSKESARRSAKKSNVHPCPLYDRLAAGCRLP
jgi:hypothetical protein